MTLPTRIGRRSPLRAGALALVATVGLTLAPATPVQGATARVVTVGSTFVPPSVTVSQGDQLDLVNAEPVPHDVTSTDSTPEGVPLFQSDTISVGTAPVVGVAALEPGVYGFYCTIHNFMRGTLFVDEAAGSPLPVDPPPLPNVTVTGGSVPTPTSITAFDGSLYVASYGNGTVSRLPILSGGLLGPATTYAAGFSNPLGVVFAPDGTLFVSDSHPSQRTDRATAGRVWAVPRSGGVAGTAEVVIDELPNGRHNTNGMAVLGDRLYITNGNSTDDGASGGQPEEPLSGTLVSVPLTARGLTPSSSDPDLVVEALGMRNSFDVAFRPETSEAWMAMNGLDTQDPYGEDLLLRAAIAPLTTPAPAALEAATTAAPPPRVATDFGFPGCVYAAGPGGTVLMGQNANPAVADVCGTDHTRPEALLGLHVSANGLAFGPSDPYWDGDLFIAEFGNTFGAAVAGHKVVRIPIDEAGRAGRPEDVMVGVAPLDLAFGPPGTGLYVADFATGLITLLRAPA